MPDAETLGLKSHSEPALFGDEQAGDGSGSGMATPAADSSPPTGLSTPDSTNLSRTGSFSEGGSIGRYDEDADDDSPLPPLERLTALDILENLALPARLERLSQSLSARTEAVKRHQRRLRSTGRSAKDRVVDEWRRQRQQLLSPGGTAEEQMDRYRRRVRVGVERLAERWGSDAPSAVTAREKASFIFGVLNILVSGYLVGAFPGWFHLWYTVQLLYFMPIRYYTYHQKGYHYFLADLCYFVNLLLLLSLWIFPNSKRLFVSTYCLAFGNNAVAIALWRNSLVFHSLDKVTSLFIHIMPCVTLHCIIHLLPPELTEDRFPAIHFIKHSPTSDPNRWTLRAMMVWATVPYLVWQLAYHFLITVRRREQIRAGRPTSFTWLRRSYAPTWIGRLVLSLPSWAQESAFMAIQYGFAISTILPCPLWFRYRWASAAFLTTVFTWSVYNGATFYIDVFGNRFQKELENLKRDVARWQQSPDLQPGGGAGPLPSGVASGHAGTGAEAAANGAGSEAGAGSAAASGDGDRDEGQATGEKRGSIERIPPLDAASGKTTGVESGGGGRVEDGELRGRQMHS